MLVWIGCVIVIQLILIRHSKNNIRNTCGKFDRKCFFMDRSNPVFFYCKFLVISLDSSQIDSEGKKYEAFLVIKDERYQIVVEKRKLRIFPFDLVMGDFPTQM